MPRSINTTTARARNLRSKFPGTPLVEPQPRRLISAVVPFLIGFVLICSGCAGYRLNRGDPSTAGGGSIQIHPFVNQTSLPLLTEIVTPVLRRIVQQSGEFRLTSEPGADIDLRGSLIRYERESLSSQRNDILTTRDFSLVLTAEVTATNRSSGKVLFAGPVTGRTTVRVAGDLVSAERQGMANLAEDLARKLTAKLTDGSW